MLRISLGALFCLVALLYAHPLWSGFVFQTSHPDLAGHIRFVHEYAAALGEGQWPPVVAPEAESLGRIPLFQYYSGTGHAFAGAFCWLGLAPLAALCLSVFFFSVLGAFGFLLLAKFLGHSPGIARVGALAFQLFPVAAADLLNRGGYPEWESLQLLPLLTWLSLNVVARKKSEGLSSWGWGVGLAAYWAFFIPVHPLQSVLSGGLVIALALLESLRRKLPPSSRSNYLFWTALGVAWSAWFWLPIVRDYQAIAVTHQRGWFNAGVGWSQLLSPLYLKMEGETLAVRWGAPLYLGTAASLVLLARSKTLEWYCACISILLAGLVVEGARSGLLAGWLGAFQFTFRFLVPVGLVSALALTGSLSALKNRLNRFRRLSTGLVPFCGMAVLACSAPYVLLDESPASLVSLSSWIPASQELILSPEYRHTPTWEYSFVGVDYARIGWIRDGKLRLNQPIQFPQDGEVFEFCLQLKGAKGAIAGLKFVVDQAPVLSQLLPQSDGTWEFRALMTPALGNGTTRPVVVFSSPGKGEIQVLSQKYRRLERWPKRLWLSESQFLLSDPWVTPLPSGKWKPSESSRRRVDVASPGIYQIPVACFSNAEMKVDGKSVISLSGNRRFWVAFLSKGHHLLEFTNHLDIMALYLMGASLLLVVAMGLKQVGVGPFLRHVSTLFPRPTPNDVRT